MAYIEYPRPRIETKLGPVALAFTNGSHVCVQTDRAYVNSGGQAISYRGTEYIGMVHLHAEHGWGEEPGDSDHLSKRQVGASVRAPKTHRVAIVAALTEAVKDYLAANPDTLRAAEYADANNDADRCAKTVAELTAQLNEAVKAEAKQRARMAANAPGRNVTV